MDIINTLEKLNFTKLEAQLYMALLGNKALSAYQLAKKVEMSRPSIYNALEHMVDKGMIQIIPNETRLYLAEKPAVILERMDLERKQNLERAKKELAKYEKEKYEEMTVNFKGFESVVIKTKEIIEKAKKDIYINADFELNSMKKQLEDAVSRGLHISIFSFYAISIPVQGISYYSHNRELGNHIPSRFMAAVDEEIALVADGSSIFESWKGTISNNSLFIKIISEHIHNDIYLLKLKNKYGKEIYEDFIYLNTDFEKRQKEEIEN